MLWPAWSSLRSPRRQIMGCLPCLSLGMLAYSSHRLQKVVSS
jgi:hypothetical protein